MFFASCRKITLFGVSQQHSQCGGQSGLSVPLSACLPPPQVHLPGQTSGVRSLGVKSPCVRETCVGARWC